MLMRTLEAFQHLCDKMVLVLPQAHQQLWRQLCHEHNFEVSHRVVLGGETRWQSVKNALNAIDVEQGDVIAVHDGVRPLVSSRLISQAFEMAQKYGSAVPVIPVTDSIRQMDDECASHIVSRAVLRAVQTPQAFDAVALKVAYDLPYQEVYTDDASVYEHAGHQVTLFDGETTNIKITHPSDLILAQTILSHG